MDRITVSSFLKGKGACQEGAAFAKQYTTMQAVWENCRRSDWMLWILDNSRPMDDRMARLFACWCVRYTPLADGRKLWDILDDDRSREAVIVAERFANGAASRTELDAAWGAARDAAWDAAWGAAWDAARDAQCNEIRRLIPDIDEWVHGS